VAGEVMHAIKDLFSKRVAQTPQCRTKNEKRKTVKAPGLTAAQTCRTKEPMLGGGQWKAAAAARGQARGKSPKAL